jgi:NAD(P)-dependent dehydrogenase (short-subunit alcohol dehydrogenase family)
MSAAPAGGLEGQVALVTGASRGIGRAVAVELASLGAEVALVARIRDPLTALAGELGGWAIPCDLTDAGAVAGLPDRVGELAGRPPGVVVTAAGVFTLAPVHETPVEALDLNLEVNLRGGILTVCAFLPPMLRAGRGTIVQVGSMAGRRALPGNGAYSASKFGLRGFHEVLIEELRGTGVRATLLEPAATDTSIWDPMDPDADPGLPDRAAMLRPEEVARAVAFVATRPDRVQIPFLPLELS